MCTCAHGTDIFSDIYFEIVDSCCFTSDSWHLIEKPLLQVPHSCRHRNLYTRWFHKDDWIINSYVHVNKYTLGSLLSGKFLFPYRFLKLYYMLYLENKDWILTRFGNEKIGMLFNIYNINEILTKSGEQQLWYWLQECCLICLCESFDSWSYQVEHLLIDQCIFTIGSFLHTHLEFAWTNTKWRWLAVFIYIPYLFQ